MPVNKYAKGGTSTLIRIAFRNIWRNKRRTAFCLNAVGITAFVLVFFIVAITFRYTL